MQEGPKGELDAVELPGCLRPGTQRFVRDHRAVLDHSLELARQALIDDAERWEWDEGRLLHRRMVECSDAWALFFWARLGHYRLERGYTVVKALDFADQDLLGLSGLINPL